MVRYEIMGLYQLKDFLTFDDVADYLTDKGVYDFDLTHEYDYRKLKSFIKELYQGGKITPIFYCEASLFKIHGFDDKKEVEPPTMVGFSYFICNRDMMKAFFNDCPIHTNFCVDDAKTFYRLYQDTSPYYIYIARDNENDFEVEILFPKAQLDNLFLQHQKDSLQQQINTIDSQLNDKELSTRSQNTAGTIIAGLANLANIDLKNPYGDDSNKKIRQELLKLGFKANEKDGLPLSDGTIATWLKIADDLSK